MFNVTKVIDDFMANRYVSERNELVHRFSNAFAENRALKMFLAEVCDECAKAKQPPIMSMGQAMMYGMVLGVLMEREERRRVKLT